MLLTDERRFDEAQALFAEALAIRIKALGERHSAVAEVKSNLGALAFARGDSGEAERRQRDVLATEEAVRSPGDPEIAVALGNLAQVLMAEDKAEEAARTARSRAGDCGSPLSARTGWRPHRAAMRWRWR